MPPRDLDYPFWPPFWPRPGDAALRVTGASLVADLPVNQIFSGRMTDIPIIQKPLPRQATPTGPGLNEERGQYGTDLYTAFMAPYDKTAEKGKQT